MNNQELTELLYTIARLFLETHGVKPSGFKEAFFWARKYELLTPTEQSELALLVMNL